MEPPVDLYELDPLTFDGRGPKKGLGGGWGPTRNTALAGEAALWEIFHFLSSELGDVEGLPTPEQITAASETASLEDPAVVELFERYRALHVAAGRAFPEGLP